jgi:hypothetical protein
MLTPSLDDLVDALHRDAKILCDGLQGITLGVALADEAVAFLSREVFVGDGLLRQRKAFVETLKQPFYGGFQGGYGEGSNTRPNQVLTLKSFIRMDV